MKVETKPHYTARPSPYSRPTRPTTSATGPSQNTSSDGDPSSKCCARPTTSQPPTPLNVANNTSKKADSEYVINFGSTFQGRRLSELPAWYIRWLKKEVKNRPDLTEALASFNSAPTTATTANPAQPQTLPSQGMQSWRPPNKHMAPDRFRDDYTGDNLWISAWDSRNYFDLTRDHLINIPMAHGKNALGKPSGSTPTRPKYWLYDVWDFVRARDSQAIADRALRRFLTKNQRREGEIMEEMGLY